MSSEIAEVNIALMFVVLSEFCVHRVTGGKAGETAHVIGMIDMTL